MSESHLANVPYGAESDKKSKVSCTSCRSRKVLCNTSTPSETCDQCKRHNLECVYVEHRRGRKLGSKNLRSVRGATGRSSSQPDNGFQQSNYPFQQPDSIADVGPESAESSRRPLSRTLNEGAYNPGRPDSAAGGRFTQPLIENLDPALGRLTTQGHGFQEQSPLALLAKTAEARSQGDEVLARPSNGRITEQAQSSRLASKWSSRNRYASKLDVDAQLDPVNMGMLSIQTAEKLFDLFWSKLANYAAFLDYRIHTLYHVRRSSTLLTCIILQTAARHTPIHAVPDAARLSIALDRHINSILWPRILIGNNKSVEICQACMLWATFLAEPKPGEEDLGWSLFGHAIRIAVEIGLNLDPPPAPTQQTHEPALLARNSERTWLTCFIADRSWATQLGRPPLIAEASLTANLQDWLKDTAACFEDQSIVALIKLRRILTDKAATHFERMCIIAALEAWRHDWVGKHTKSSYRLGYLGDVYYHYAHIVLRLQWMSLRDNIQRTNEKVALEHAASLLQYAALDLPDDVYQYGHNNFFTMLSLPVAVLIQSQEARTAPGGMYETFALSMTTILERLRTAISQTPHQEGANQWHASFFEKALERVATPGTVADSDILEMLNITIPGDLMDMISWDLPGVVSEWTEGV